jgi:hypothetical protein
MSEEIEKIYDDVVASGLLPGVSVFAGDRSGRFTPSRCNLHYGSIFHSMVQPTYFPSQVNFSSLKQWVKEA